MGVALHFSLQLANHKSQRSDFGAVCKANNDIKRFHHRWMIFFDEKEGTTILERVAFLLRLSICVLGAKNYCIDMVPLRTDSIWPSSRDFSSYHINEQRSLRQGCT